MTRSTCTVIPLESHRQNRAQRRREKLYYLLAIIPQRLSLGTLILYALLRVLIAPDLPLTYYTGPLFLLWPLAFFFLLVSYISDWLLWEE